MKTLRLLLLATLTWLPTTAAQPKLRVLIVDGQNNHSVWPKSTAMMRAYFEDSERFEVDVARTRYTWQGEKWLLHYSLDDGKEYQDLPEPQPDPTFIPDFSCYDVVVSNFGWKAADWPADSRRALETFVSGGGGFVTVHAANNAFPQWEVYNRMIGLGGWGGRNEQNGPYVYYDNAGRLVRDTKPGRAGAHGPEHEFVVQIREPQHAIVAGMPEKWRHTRDECYDRLRGPAENMTVLATAFSSPEYKGTGRYEPVLLTVQFGRGRIFHTTLGHEADSFEGVGFITTLLRGTEWAATGQVTLPIPADFPTETEATHRPFPRK